MNRLPSPVDPYETLPMPESAKPIHMPLPGNRSAGGRFVLHVDGIGSFQVIEQPVVVIGPASAAVAADVSILAGAGVPPVTITRTDGDYFLQSREAVQVNEKPTTGKLLSGGDKIALGPRCRLSFRRPSAASGTAILDLTGARLARGDVRQVILLDREILIGPGAGAHIRCDALAQAAILQRNSGKLFLRSAEPMQIDGRAAPSPAEVSPGAHVRVGPVSFVVGKE